MKHLLYKILTFVFSVGASGAIASAAQENPQSFTFDGRVYSNAAATTPLLDSIALRIQILNQAQDCILYEEQQTINTTATDGQFTIQVGSATGAAKRGALDSNHTMATVYSNTMASISGKLVSNGAACTYNPVAAHQRYVRIQMTPASDGLLRTMSSNMALDSVPYANIAERAESLQGLYPSDLILVNGATAVLTQANAESIFSATNFARLTSLLSVPPVNYVQTGTNGSAALPVVAGNPGSGLAAGQIWYDSSSNVLKYYDGAVKTVGTGAPVFASQSANTFLAAPTGSAGVPGFRTIAAVDLPATVIYNGGNTVAGAMNIGSATGSSQNVNIVTSGFGRMTIDSAGSIGIPSAVDANGRISTDGTGTKYGLSLLNSDAGGVTWYVGSSANTWSSGGGQFLISKSTTASAASLAINNAGNVSIGSTVARAQLDVNGTITGKASTLNGTATIDFGTGNIQHTIANCGAFALWNLKDGASYMFVVKGTVVATCSFTAFSGAGAGALTVHLPPGHGATTTGTHTIYNLAVSGGDVYLAWTPGY